SPHAYLQVSQGNPAVDALRFLTVGDTTYIVNTTKTPAMKSTTTAAPANYAFVWIKAAPYVDFTLTVKRTDGGTPGTVTATMDNNASGNKFDSTEDLASDLRDELNGETIADGVTVVAEALGNLIIVRLSDDSAFTIEARDGWG